MKKTTLFLSVLAVVAGIAPLNVTVETVAPERLELDVDIPVTVDIDEFVQFFVAQKWV